MSMTGLRRQEELGNREKLLNFPSSDLIMWAELYPNEPQTWAYRFGFRKNREISYTGLMVKEAY